MKQTLAEKEKALEEEKKLYGSSQEKLKEMARAQEDLQSQVNERTAEKNQLAGEFSKLKEEVDQDTMSRSNESEKNQQIENQLKVIISVLFD